MSLRTSTALGAMVLYASVPSFAQCAAHRGHATHDHAGHQESAPKVTATNTLCPVMGKAVKPGRDKEVAVNGNTYRVCCDGCGPELAEHREKYLDKDGKPLNAPTPEKAEPEGEAPAPHQH